MAVVHIYGSSRQFLSDRDLRVAPCALALVRKPVKSSLNPDF